MSKLLLVKLDDSEAGGEEKRRPVLVAGIDAAARKDVKK